MASHEVPSTWLYRGAVAVIVLGLAAAFAWFNWALDDQTRAVNDFQRLPPRSGFPVEIDQPGTYTIWAGAACGGLCDIPPLSEMYELLVLGFESPSGEVIRPEPFPGRESYRVDGTQHGKAAWIVEFDEAGTYTLERRNLGTGAVLLLLGEGVGLSTDLVGGLLLIGAVTIVVATTSFVIGWYRRRRAMIALVEKITSS